MYSLYKELGEYFLSVICFHLSGIVGSNAIFYFSHPRFIDSRIDHT